MDELCHYTGIDSRAAVGTNDDGTWFSRCHCLTPEGQPTVTCTSGTYEDAVAALEAHRGVES